MNPQICPSTFPSGLNSAHSAPNRALSAFRFPCSELRLALAPSLCLTRLPGTVFIFCCWFNLFQYIFVLLFLKNNKIITNKRNSSHTKYTQLTESLLPHSQVKLIPSHHFHSILISILWFRSLCFPCSFLLV